VVTDTVWNVGYVISKEVFLVVIHFYDACGIIVKLHCFYKQYNTFLDAVERKEISGEPSIKKKYVNSSLRLTGIISFVQELIVLNV